jgi:plasmid stabilization system protein ParE
MTSVAYAQAALRDLEELTDFLFGTDPDAAIETVELVRSAIEILDLHPLIGRPTESGLRELVISRGRSGYLALYAYDSFCDRVMVLAVRHQREAGYVSPDG